MFSPDISNFQQQQPLHQQQQQQQQQEPQLQNEFVNNDLELPNDITANTLEESADKITLSFLNNFLSGETEIKTEPADLTFPPDTPAHTEGAEIPNEFSFTGFLTEQSNGQWNANSPMNEDDWLIMHN